MLLNEATTRAPRHSSLTGRLDRQFIHSGRPFWGMFEVGDMAEAPGAWAAPQPFSAPRKSRSMPLNQSDAAVQALVGSWQSRSLDSARPTPLGLAHSRSHLAPSPSKLDRPMSPRLASYRSVVEFGSDRNRACVHSNINPGEAIELAGDGWAATPPLTFFVPPLPSRPPLQGRRSPGHAGQYQTEMFSGPELPDNVHSSKIGGPGPSVLNLAPDYKQSCKRPANPQADC
jgi:hypothetical protein